jgi:hypothetical protein
VNSSATLPRLKRLALIAALLPASLLPAVQATANDVSFGFVGETLEMREEADLSLVSEHLVFDWIEPKSIPNTGDYGGELCPDGWTYEPVSSQCTRGSGY